MYHSNDQMNLINKWLLVDIENGKQGEALLFFSCLFEEWSSLNAAVSPSTTRVLFLTTSHLNRSRSCLDSMSSEARTSTHKLMATCNLLVSKYILNKPQMFAFRERFPATSFMTIAIKQIKMLLFHTWKNSTVTRLSRGLLPPLPHQSGLMSRLTHQVSVFLLVNQVEPVLRHRNTLLYKPMLVKVIHSMDLWIILWIHTLNFKLMWLSRLITSGMASRDTTHSSLGVLQHHLLWCTRTNALDILKHRARYIFNLQIVLEFHAQAQLCQSPDHIIHHTLRKETTLVSQCRDLWQDTPVMPTRWNQEPDLNI